MAALPHRGAGAQAGRRVARELSPSLGGALRSARRLPARVAGAGKGQEGQWAGGQDARRRRAVAPRNNLATADDRTLVIERVFDAPVDARLEVLDREEASRPVERAARLHDSVFRGRSASGRQVALLHARAQRQRAVARRRLSRDRSEQAARDDARLGGRRRARSRDARDGAVRRISAAGPGSRSNRPASTPPARATAMRTAGANASTFSPNISQRSAPERSHSGRKGKSWTPSPSTR